MSILDTDRQDSSTSIDPFALLTTRNPQSTMCLPVSFQKVLGLIPPPITEFHVEMSSTREHCGQALRRTYVHSSYCMPQQSMPRGLVVPAWLAFPWHLYPYPAPSALALVHPCPRLVIPSCFLSLCASFSSKGH